MKQDATKQQEAEARAKSLRDDLIYNTVPGMVRLLEGDVVQLDGGPHIVTRSNQSGATVQPLQKKHVERETLGGRKVEFWAKQRVQHISGCVPKYLILERRGDAGLQEFLDGKNLPNRQTPPAAGQSETGGDNQTTESSEVMAAKKKTTKESRTKKQAEATESAEATVSNLFGFGTISVVRKLKQAGHKTEQICEAFKRLKVNYNESTVRSTSGNYKPETAAKLTSEQVKEIMS